MPVTFEILSEWGLYLELSNETTACVFFVFREKRNRVGGDGNAKAQTQNCTVFFPRAPKSRRWTNAKTGNTERREEAQKSDPRQRAYCKDTLSGTLCFDLPTGAGKSSVFNGCGLPGAPPGGQKEGRCEGPKQILLFLCRGERRARERGREAFCNTLERFPIMSEAPGREF